MENQYDEEWLLDLVRLRSAVGLMGEAPEAGWWESRSLGSVGQRVLARLFPVAPLAAALGTTTAAAAAVHDAHIGRSRVWHLFRLPVAIEEEVAAALGDSGPEGLAAAVRDANGAREALAALAGGAARTDAEGPVAVGPVASLKKSATLSSVAALYLEAFERGRPVYPYLTEAA